MIAAKRVKNPDTLDILRNWWEAKFHLPSTHECFQQLTLLELLTMFWEDYYRKNPIEASQTQDGQVVFSNTGDPLIDKWEREIAQGLEPDLLDGVSTEERRHEEAARAKLSHEDAQIAKEIGLAEGFSETYG